MFTRNSTFGPPFGQEDDQIQSDYYTSMSRQQDIAVINNSSRSELQWASGLHREGYAPSDLTSSTSSWSNTTFPDPSSVYGGRVWPGDPRHDETLFGSWFGAPGGNTDGLGLNPMGMEVVAPAPRALPASYPCTPRSLNWPQAPGPLQPTPSWNHPMHTAKQHNDHGSSVSSLVMRPENAPYHMATSLVVVESSERRFVPTGPLPPTTPQSSVQLSTPSDPVSVPSSAPRSRDERWDLSNEATFQCLWTSHCGALIAGNRKSVTTHLRNEHDFTCDDQVIACAWDECATYMQRRNIARHVVACHFAIKVTCPHCGLRLSRADANKKHRVACMAGQTTTPGVVMEEEMGADEDG